MERNEAPSWNRAAQSSCEPASSEIVLPFEAIMYREYSGRLATSTTVVQGYPVYSEWKVQQRKVMYHKMSRFDPHFPEQGTASEMEQKHGLRKHEESIRGLSDASALVASASSAEASELSSDPGRSGSEVLLFETSPRAEGNHDPISCRRPTLENTRAQKDHSARRGSNSSTSESSVGLVSWGSDRGKEKSGGGGSGGCSFLQANVGNLGDSAETRAARELEDLRAEKESLQVMKQQLAAVHQLRVDLKKKDSVIQSLQMKVREGKATKDKAERLEVHCHILEERCSCLESSNADYAEKLGALDQKSKTRIDELLRDVDDLGGRLRNAEAEVKQEKSRSEAEAATHKKQQEAAAAEGIDARGLVEDLKTSLKEAAAQAKRRKERSIEAEKLLTSQLEETKVSLLHAERRSSAAIEARRRDSVAATEAAAALQKHLEVVQGGGAGTRQEDGGSTEAFVELTARWRGNEILALVWVEVSKALEALDRARAGEAAAISSLRETKRQVSERQEEASLLRAEIENLRTKVSRLQDVEERLGSTSARLESARESVSKRDRLAEALWIQLSALGVLSSNPLVETSSPFGRAEDCSLLKERAVGDLVFSSREAEIIGGLKRLATDWKERGKALENLAQRSGEERARWDDNKARLETLLEAAKKEAGHRGDELARLMVEFQTRLASAEARVVEKVAKAKEDAEAEAVEKVTEALKEADRRISEAAVGARRNEDSVTVEANRRVSAAEEAKAIAEEAKTASAEEAKAAMKQARAAMEGAEAALKGRRSAESALRVLGRFVGPLRRLCLELREQKKFLARSYRRHAPLQAELFAVAAAVSGKDYWCLWGGSATGATAVGVPPATDIDARRGQSWTNLVGDENLEIPAVSPPDVPPSLRAVVIAVIAANRLMKGFSGCFGGGRGGRRNRQGIEDTRYMPRASWSRAFGLPVLPRRSVKQELEMPRAEELEALPDGRAVEVVLSRLLVFDEEDGVDTTGGARASLDSSPPTRYGGVRNMQELWRGDGRMGGGDLLHYLLRGRKEHVTRVKERGLAVDPRTFPFHSQYKSLRREQACRVRLGRRVREEMERSLWLGEGPGQPGSLHLRDIRKALAALSRELNASEGKRLELEGALRSAGGGSGIQELENSAAALKRRVGLLETEVSARPDEAAFSQLSEEKEKLSKEAAELRDRVRGLEAAVMTAKSAVQEAIAESQGVRLERDAAEERARKREAARRELADEVEQLKEFARRANIERDECVMRERATSRKRGEGGCSDVISGGSGIRGGGRGGMENERAAKAEELLRSCREEEARLRARCSQLEACVVEIRSLLEEQKTTVKSLREEVDKAHGDAEKAKNQVHELAERNIRRESEHRRQVSVLEARLVEAGAKSTRRRDLLQLQASAQNDLQQALFDAMPAGVDGEGNGIGDIRASVEGSPRRLDVDDEGKEAS